jgi:glutaredoxin
MKSPPPIVVLYTRPKCGLCEKVLEIMAKFQPEEKFVLEVVDISTDPHLTALFGHDIPAVFINGFYSFKHGISPDRFLAKYRRLKAFRKPDRDLRNPGAAYVKVPANK